MYAFDASTSVISVLSNEDVNSAREAILAEGGVVNQARYGIALFTDWVEENPIGGVGAVIGAIAFFFGLFNMTMMGGKKKNKRRSGDAKKNDDAASNGNGVHEDGDDEQEDEDDLVVVVVVVVGAAAAVAVGGDEDVVVLTVSQP